MSNTIITFLQNNINSLVTKFLPLVYIIIVIAVLLFFIKAIGLYVIAKNRNEKLAFLAFIPYGCLYLKGKIIKSTKIFGVEINNAELLLPILLVSTVFPMTHFFSIFLLLICYFAILYRLYQKIIPNFAIVLIILSIIFPITEPLILFLCRTNKKDHN